MTLNHGNIITECMSGSISVYKGSWYVQWYDKRIKRGVKIYRYKGEKIYHKKTAQKLLAVIQSDVENNTFYLEKYTERGFSEIVPFLEKWVVNSKQSLTPSTYKGYKGYVNNYIKPYFIKNNQLTLQDIQLDILEDFKNSLDLAPKTKWNIMNCFHVIMDKAKRSRRINHMPSFPKKKDYQLIQKPIKWLPEVRQLNVLEHIPKQHQPIFYFLKYHLRRPAEACALQKEDYSDGVFTISRSISNRQLVNKTKTGAIHTIPCHPDFKPFFKVERSKSILSPFFFCNPTARKTGQRYTNKALNLIWHKACEKAGEDIDLYSGLKHSSCSQYINEKGLSESELQIITDHANIQSVRHYAKTEVKRKKELMMKNVFELKRNTSNE